MTPRKEHVPLDGAHVTVMGLGRFGGGLGVTRWLCSQGADVLVTDLEPAEKLTASVDALRDLEAQGRVTFRLGTHNISDFTTCDLVVANPAVPKPWDNRFLRAAEATKVPITTEMTLLVDRLPNRAGVIGITGSVGKSTTTAMTHHALSGVLGAKWAVMGGNIGGSLLDKLESITPDTRVVLELSSAMLYWLDRTTAFAPGVAVLTGFSANHVDWHGSLDHYRESKALIFKHQQPGDTAVLGPALESWDPHASRSGVHVIHVDPRTFVWPLSAPGNHNRANAAAALAACCAIEPTVDPESFAKALRSFTGLSHRLELVGEFGGVTYYNDSKSTTPESLSTALAAVAEDGGTQRVHLIAGGYDKKTDLSGVGALAPSLAGLYTIGATGAAIAASAGGNATQCGTLERAILEVKQRVRPGDVVLLSPACASWDQFENFEQRGDLFRTLVTGRSVENA